MELFASSVILRRVPSKYIRSVLGKFAGDTDLL